MSFGLESHFEMRTTGNDANGGGVINTVEVHDLISNGTGQVKSPSVVGAVNNVNANLIIFGGNGQPWILGIYLITAYNAGTGFATLNNNPGINLTEGDAYVCGGLDYSQQDVAQYSFADLASANGTTNPPQVTSASHAFVAADVGNIIQITGGVNFIPQFYGITSVAAGAATLDKPCGSAAACSAGVWAEGGALLTPAKLAVCTANYSAGSNNGVGGIAWIKKGTYTVTATIDWGLQSFMHFVGYDTVHGDDTGAVNRPLITTSTAATDLMKINGNNSAHVVFDNINFSNTSGGARAIGIWTYTNSTLAISFRRSHMTGFTNAINGDNVGAHFVFVFVGLENCEIDHCTATAVTNFWGSICHGCYFHDNQSGVTSNRGGIFSFCIFYNQTTYGIQIGSFAGGEQGWDTHLFHCNFVSNGTDGAAISSSDNRIVVSVNNCIFWGNGNIGLNNSGAPSRIFVIGYSNAFGNNTNGDINDTGGNGMLYDMSRGRLTVSPFNGVTDWSLNNTAGGGLVCAGKAFPTPVVFFGTTPATAGNIGAIQNTVNTNVVTVNVPAPGAAWT